MADQTTIETYTRAQIRAEIERFSARERELTARAAQLYANGQGGAGSPVNERDRLVHERARQMLNGHGGLLPSLSSGQTEQEVLAERAAVRLALSVLQRADVEAATVEAVSWAQAHKQEWLTLMRDWVLAAARFTALEASARQFRETAGEASHALPLTNLAAGTGCTLDLGPWQFIEDAISAALEGGAVSAGDLKKARSV